MVKPLDVNYKTWESDVQQFVKKKKNIIYGARALNQNLPGLMRRYTNDFDIWTRSYKKDAYALEVELEQRYPGNHYHVKQVVIPDGKTVYRVLHTPTSQVIADFSRVPAKSSYREKEGLQIQTLQDQKRRLEAILCNPEKHYRHRKAKSDLNRINYYLRQTGVL